VDANMRLREQGLDLINANFNLPGRHNILAKRKSIVSGYTKLWDVMIREWRAPRITDAVWLIYAASYLFNTRGLKWAVDPVSLGNLVPEAPAIDAGRDLNDLDFVLLTHDHADHTDIGLWNQIKDSRCHWVVPAHMAERFFDNMRLKRPRCSVVVPEQKIMLAGACITPFDAPHTPPGATNKINAFGYLVETANGSYLLPGDIRAYDPLCLERFKGVSAVFAHVFLGRAAARDFNPPLLAAFVKFYLNCHPKKIVLAHLYEFARQPEDCWLAEHADALARVFAAADHELAIVTPEWFKETLL